MINKEKILTVEEIMRKGSSNRSRVERKRESERVMHLCLTNDQLINRNGNKIYIVE